MYNWLMTGEHQQARRAGDEGSPCQCFRLAARTRVESAAAAAVTHAASVTQFGKLRKNYRPRQRQEQRRCPLRLERPFFLREGSL